MHCRSIIALAVWFFSVSVAVHPAQALTWTGKWIWQSADGPSDTWMCFRKTFNLNSAPASAVAAIATDTKYWLYVNDSLVVREGGLKRGPTPNDGYYDTINLARYLAAGSNTIGVLVVYWGVDGFSHKNSKKGGLVFQMDAGGTVLQSDATWKCKAHPAFEHCQTQPNYRIAERSVRFNAQNDIPDWYKKSFNDQQWGAATEKGTPPVAPWGNLVARPIPQWKDWGVASYTSVSTSLPKSGPATFTGQTPYNMHVDARITLTSSSPGATVKINSATNSEQSLIAEYVTRGGGSDETFEMPLWINGDAIRYQIPGGVNVKSVSFRQVSYASEKTGSFTCADQFYQKLWQKSFNTLQVCMHDNYFDCPDRERALWWGDVVVEIGQTFYALDRNADKLSAKSIRELMNWQRSNNTIFSPVPAGNWNQELPPQMLASIGWEGFWNYYRNSGDSDVIKEVYPRVKKYLSVWSLDGDGLVNHRAGDWDWEDWGDRMDSRVLDNCWYYLALKAARSMAVLSKAFGDTADYGSKMRSVSGNFSKLWNSQQNAYYSPGLNTNPDDRANAMAVVAGLAPKANWPGIKRVLTTTTNASPWMEKWVEDALMLMNEDSLALVRMKSRYTGMVNSSSSTLWENFPASGTPNHSWAGGPLTLFGRFIAGVAPDSAGFSVYHILPQLNYLKTVTIAVPSVKGAISADHSMSATKYELKLTSPAGTKAIVGIPKKYAWKSVSVGDKCVWSEGTYGALAGVSSAGEDSLYIKFSVDPGTWDFTTSLNPGTVTQTVDSHSNAVLPSIRFLQSGKELRIEPAGHSPCRVTILDFCGRVVFQTSAAQGKAVVIPNASIGRGVRVVRITEGAQKLVKVVVNK
jgi:alpha-L-rhamnosidase